MFLEKIKSFFRNDSNIIKRGTVKFFNRRRGYGFIKSEKTAKDVFVHISDLEDKISQGDRVEFELKFTPKGLQAEQVQLV